MSHMRIKLTAAGLVFVLAVGYLAFAGVRKGWTYTLAVDAYVDKAEYQSQRVRLCGVVDEKHLEANPAGLTAKFVLKGHTRSVPVVYKGVVPDLFKAGGEVLVEGQRDEAGVFQANVLMTKCASKYEEAPAGHPTDRPGNQVTEQGK